MSGKALYISAVHVDNERGGEECDECADDTGGVAVHEVHESERAEAVQRGSNAASEGNVAGNSHDDYKHGEQ